MKNLFLSLTLVFAVFSATAQKAGFKAILPGITLKSDKPDPTKAILIVTSNHYGDIYAISGNKVYVTPSSVTNPGLDGEMSGTRSFYVAPGEYEFVQFTAKVSLGSNPNFSTYSRFFPYRGIFRLEAGKAYHLGYLNAIIPTFKDGRTIRLDTNGEQSCSYEANAERLAASKEYLEKYYPKIFNSVNSEIEQISFTQGYKICPAGNIIINENFADNSRRWQTTDDGTCKSYIANNSLIIENNSADSCILTIPDAKIPKSFDLQVETTWASGDNNKEFGIIIGDDVMNCFRFVITNNGYFSMKGWNKSNSLGNKMPIMLNWSKYDFINTGEVAKNIIRVQLMPIDHYTFRMFVVYVNDELVVRGTYVLDTFNNRQVRTKGVIGVYSFGKQNVAFNRLTLSEL